MDELEREAQDALIADALVYVWAFTVHDCGQATLDEFLENLRKAALRLIAIRADIP